MAGIAGMLPQHLQMKVLSMLDNEVRFGSPWRDHRVATCCARARARNPGLMVDAAPGAAALRLRSHCSCAESPWASVWIGPASSSPCLPECHQQRIGLPGIASSAPGAAAPSTRLLTL
jgi:hypothetical protein